MPSTRTNMFASLAAALAVTTGVLTSAPSADRVAAESETTPGGLSAASALPAARTEPDAAPAPEQKVARRGGGWDANGPSRDGTLEDGLALDGVTSRPVAD